MKRVKLNFILYPFETCDYWFIFQNFVSCSQNLTSIEEKTLVNVTMTPGKLSRPSSDVLMGFFFQVQKSSEFSSSYL